jgi:hypothetical protein
MTVAELIEHLQKFPQTFPVLVEGYEAGWDGIHELRTAGMVRYRKAEDWDGEFREAAEFKQSGQPAVLIFGRRDGRR